MSKNFLYVIEVRDGRKLLFDSIRATATDARRRREELKATFHTEAQSLRAKYHGADEWALPLVFVLHMDKRIAELEASKRLVRNAG